MKKLSLMKSKKFVKYVKKNLALIKIIKIHLNYTIKSKIIAITPENLEELLIVFPRTFRTNRELLQHLNFCRQRNRHEGDCLNGNKQTNNINHDNLNNNEVVDEINNATNSRQNNPHENQEYFYWNNVAGTQFANELNNTYEKIVHWKRNLFMLPSGAAEKNYIEEVTRLMKLWINDTPLRETALKAVHVMPALLLQKLSKS